jgi:hypothetical protein
MSENNEIKISVSGKILKTATIEDEWFENISKINDIYDINALKGILKKSKKKADLFSFIQVLPETRPKYDFYYEMMYMSVLPVQTYDNWWNNKIGPKTRNLVRKAEKKDVKVKVCEYNDDFVRGMVNIFDESPVRQGKPFWHYKKGFDVVKKEFAKYIFREDLIGAYSNDELIGFIMMGCCKDFAILQQIISKIGERDKSPNNLLIAKAVEICAEKKIPYLIYALWIEGSLGDFKRHNAFEKIGLPRYYIPLTLKGKIFLKLKLHNGIKPILPKRVINILLNLRRKIYSKKYQNVINE